MIVAPAAPAFRFVGITDETTVCEHCGKDDLRSTVVLALLDSDDNVTEYVRFGSTCAARALGNGATGAKVRKNAEGATVKTLIAAEDALGWLSRKHLTRDGQPDELATKLGLGAELLASIDPALLASKVQAVAEAARLGIENPTEWLRKHGYR